MIIYALVARGTNVLCEHAVRSGNFTSVTPLILGKLDASRNEKRTYVYSSMHFHYVTHNGLVFLAMAEADTPRRIPFAFLADVISRFEAQFDAGVARRAIAYSLDSAFKPTLSSRIDYYNHDPSADKISAVQSQIDDVKGVMVDNIEKVLERGEKIELLVDKTDNLSAQAFQFKKKSTSLKRAMMWKNIKMWILIGMVLAIVLWLILSFACGFDFSKCKKKKK
ncbi:synaptobrevin [Thecamonas trahens ATCC 50062]|uniref:Synaptobrevin n=1 Tax=Thecamonas trahens ATCC 50062 TaxID=461836 RepID=A0A0L0DLR9_THETB|nr:synaptobrevin [Thecamonas trahens ATCC 50062]KNC53195.1 synaptobrevin [Thecamonas trahens ATCC 50062]|eukprot:XP_013754666.1 synaptobrevin [Thecamonas trahens ATCC 50062]